MFMFSSDFLITYDLHYKKHCCCDIIYFVPGMYIDDAVEAWRSLLRAACAESVPADVYFALGNLHYVWGELLEFGKRAELGAEVRVCWSDLAVVISFLLYKTLQQHACKRAHALLLCHTRR